MTGYCKIKPYFFLHFGIEAEFGIVSAMLSIITAPSAAKSFVKLLRSALDSLKSIRQRLVLHKCAYCAYGSLLESAYLAP